MIAFVILLLGSLLLGQLGAFIPWGGVVLYVHDVAVVLLVVFGFITGRQKHIHPKLISPIVAFILAAIASLLVALTRFSPAEVMSGALYLIRWVAYAAVYVMLVRKNVSGTTLLRGLFAMTSMFSVLGLIQFVLYPNLRNLEYLGWDPHYYRLFSTFLDPNFAGLFILLGFWAGMYLMQKKISLLTVGLIVIHVVALYLTYSRGSYLALGVSVGAWIMAKKYWKAVWVCIVGAVLIFMIPRPGGDTLKLTRMDSTVSRLSNWQEAAGLATQSPLVGYGFNTLKYVRRPSVTTLPDDPTSRAAGGVDNSFLFLWVTSGILGLGAYLWLLYRTIREGDAIDTAILTALVVHSQFINSLFYPWIMIWWWIYLAARENLRKPTKSS
jgi:O-antigen ligase